MSRHLGDERKRSSAGPLLRQDSRPEHDPHVRGRRRTLGPALSPGLICSNINYTVVQKRHSFSFYSGFYKSWAWWDWPLTWLNSRCPSLLWHYWLGHLTHKLVCELTYIVSSVIVNPTMLCLYHQAVLLYWWLTAQRCYVHFLTKLRFWYQVIARAFSYLWTKCDILIRYRNKEKWLYWSSSWNLKDVMPIPLFHKGFKSSRWINSYA